MKILITGGAGFIGSNLGRTLARDGHNITFIDSLKYGYAENLDFPELESSTKIFQDLRNLDLRAILRDQEMVFHFAGISSLPECEANPYEAFDVNTSLVAKILDASRHSSVKRIFLASTSAVYENNIGANLEIDSVEPDLIYPLTKKSAEEICHSYFENYGMPVVICRFFNVYGPNQDFKREFPPFTSYLVRELNADRAPTIYNSSKVRRDYIYVDDLIGMLVALMHTPNHIDGEIFNLTSNMAYTPLEILESLSSILGKDISYKDGDARNFWTKENRLAEGNFYLSLARIEKEVFKASSGSNAKIGRYFDLNKLTDIHTGLRKVLEFQRSN
jgi:nucleoside-diphosphate-sugar epimerase